MKVHNKSIQRSWDKLESFFTPQLYRSPSVRPPTSKPRDSVTKSLSRSRSRAHKQSISSSFIPGVTQGQIEQLYYAKCSDLQIKGQSDHKSKFFVYCSTHFLSKEIRLVDYGLGPNSGKVLGEILMRNPVFCYIKLGRNFLGDEGVKNLLQGVVNNTSIVHLDLCNNSINSEGALYLLRTLGNHKTLYSLNLGSTENFHRNKLGKAGGCEIEVFLNRNTVIGILNLYGAGISESILEISRGVENSKSLVSLNLGGNGLGPVEIGILFGYIKNSQILIIDLSENCIGNQGCAAIADLLASDYHLEQLSVKENDIKYKGCKELFSALYSNSYLRILDISLNPIKYLPIEVSQSLENNASLKEINFSECLLKKEAISIIGTLFSKNKTIETVNLSGNNIDDIKAGYISNGLSKNQCLKSVNLSRNKIKNQGAKYLAGVLKINQSIIEINLKENSIKDAGAEEFAETIRFNTSILRINLESNSVGSKQIDTINKLLKNNIELVNKSAPTLVKKKLASIGYNKDSLKNIHIQYMQTAKEKEEVLSRIIKQNERFDEERKIQHDKFEKIHNEYLELKQKNFRLSEALEITEKEMIVRYT